MKEIKFRAWDKANKYMWPVAALHFTRNEVMYHAGEPKLGGAVVKIDDCIVMQYTGLKDKNGVEVYEGDIIVCHKCDDAIYEIKWYDGKNDFAGQLGWNIIASEAEEVEVIGNIYENPELLK